MPTAEAEALIHDLNQIEAEAKEFFASLPEMEYTDWWSTHGRDHYWEQVPPDQQDDVAPLLERLVDLGQNASLAIRRSPLLDQPDVVASGHLVRALRAALLLRKYERWDPDVLHDEGTVLGLKPGGSSDSQAEHPRGAERQFVESAAELRSLLVLVGPGGPSAGGMPSVVERAGVRPGTAFIMMSMQPDDPFLTDVCDTVKRCFDQFGIQAVRADDIEHEGVITQKILDQIRTAEFLFADLSGERPSVYYEVGYAHALQRRVILFRKAGTVIHFDLAAYNCPEYENMRSLAEQLTRRLEANTGKKAPESR